MLTLLAGRGGGGSRAGDSGAGHAGGSGHAGALSRSGGGGRSRGGRGVGTVAGEVVGRVGSGAGVGSAAGDGGLGRSAAATAVEELAELTGAGDVPDQGVTADGRSAAGEVGSGEGTSSHDGSGEERGGGTHFDMCW